MTYRQIGSNHFYISLKETCSLVGRALRTNQITYMSKFQKSL